MSNSRVTLNSKLTVVSSKPVSSGKVHALSALDQAMASHTLHVIFYYENEDKWFESFDLDPLRESLCEVLTLSPTLTGRLGPGVDGGWEVKCNDAGVRVIKATVDATLHQWLRSASGSEEKLLVAWDHMPPHHDPSTWPPFRIQINSFEGGGVAIGLSCTHMLADLTFLASFFESWTQVHRHVPITHPTRVAPLPNHALPHAESPSPTNATLPTATFKFPGSAIKQRLSDLRHTCPNATPFDLLAAVFWTRIKSDGHITLCTDFRAKESLPLGYLGNAMRFSRVSRKVEGEELGHVVSAVHAHLEEESEGGSNYEYGAELTCVCMEHLLTREGDQTSSLLYAPSFCADEKPLHVSCRVGNVGSGGLILVMPSREGGFSRTVTVTLPEEEELAKLIKDEVILELEPAMVLSGSLQGQS
ncbi:protein ECERIFERUM 26-like [Cajanus cajan]|uniref:Vinorine synthase n=1 Tax=Cajanus cajan TaxID=3821 RepID=A0A151TXN6_CAJCA|nr:protein ECERIFERUM 26-like [Cajanus cajan]KYP71810.1 Vinorine synthase [Cajanus cajan]